MIKHLISIAMLLMPLFVCGQRNEWWRKKIDFGDNTIDEVNFLLDLSVDFYKADKYTQAIKAGQKLIKVYNKNFDKDGNIPIYYSNLATFYAAAGNYNKAERFGSEAVRLFEKYSDKYDPAYAICLHNLAYCNCKLGYLEDAIYYIEKSVTIFENMHNPNYNQDYYAALRDQTYFNGFIGYLDDAIKYGNKTMSFFKAHFDEHNADYIDLMLEIARYHWTQGNYTDVLRLYERAYSLSLKTDDAFDQYLFSLEKLNDFYYEVGNYDAAITCGLMSLAFEKLMNGDQTIQYAYCLSGVAKNYCEVKRIPEAIELEQQAIDILSKQKRKDVFGVYGTALCNMGGFCYENGEITKAISIGKKAPKIYRKDDQYNYSIYAKMVQNLSVYYFSIQQYRQSLRFAKRSSKILKVYGEYHPDYINSLHTLGLMHFFNGHNNKAITLLSDSYNKSNEYILTNFATMTYAERSNLWAKHAEFFENTLPYVAFKQPIDTFCSIAYNALLMSKGLTLNSEIEIHKFIENSNDTILQKRYRQIRADLAKLDMLCHQPPNKRKDEIDMLRNKINQAEIDLVEKSKTIGDYTRNLSLTFQNILNNLSDNDIAIEFANFATQYYNQYVAFVLKKGMTSPKVVNLFEIADFNAIYSRNYYTTSELYNLIWKPLQPYLQNVKNVYFSPSGKLHTIGIEYLPDSVGNVFSDKYNVYRLSSTRELALPKISNPNKKAATFGGIKYDTDTISNGNGVMYLAGTKKESEAVAALLRAAEYDVYAESDSAATEESLKKLSGQGIKILHISTHGFYQSEVDLASSGLGFLAKDAFTKEDRSLDCSGLLFAGANAVLDSVSRNAILEGNDDGILTAKEISRLDFRGLELVILSACQTGLGEVTGEGVFGLQRGFKKAGAQTIIMSLWDVDDYATRLLMVQFFNNLTAGKSKREAFQAAINYVKSKNDDPKYWAAFVMVDGQE